MIQKLLNSITWADIEALAQQSIPESTSLEFKEEPIKDNLEVARDVSAMANGGGGDIILGVPETNGVAQPPKTFSNGEREADRVVQIVAAGVSPFPRAMATRVIPGPGGDVVVARVPRSRLACMVHLYGPRTEFWVRRDRQRVPMAHSEIVNMVRAGLEETSRIETFIQDRIERFLSRRKKGLALYLAVTPDASPDRRIVPVRDGAVHAIMRDSSRNGDSFVWGVSPHPSINGLKGTVGDTYFFEIHQNAHVEIRAFDVNGLVVELKGGKPPEGAVPLNGYFLASSIVEIVHRARRLFDLAGMYDSFVMTLVLASARDTLLPRRHVVFEGPIIGEDLGTQWLDDNLKVQEPGYPDDANDLSAKRLCDRLWQAYGHWDCTLFDSENWFQRASGCF